MQYMGGKSKLVKYIVGFLAESLAHHNGRLVEPFVGGFNIVPRLEKDHPGAIRSALCGDLHLGLITLWRAVQSGWTPPTELSESEYHKLKAKNDQADPLTAFAAFGCSFGGKEWGGYARPATAPNGCVRKYPPQAHNAIMRKFSRMPANLMFIHSPYDDLDVTEPSVWYCDPPYANTAKYKTGDFDSERFFAWCESLVADGHTVYVSEFSAPEHWQVVWEKDRAVHMGLKRANNGEKRKRAVDKLYRVRTG